MEDQKKNIYTALTECLEIMSMSGLDVLPEGNEQELNHLLALSDALELEQNSLIHSNVAAIVNLPAVAAQIYNPNQTNSQNQIYNPNLLDKQNQIYSPNQTNNQNQTDNQNQPDKISGMTSRTISDANTFAQSVAHLNSSLNTNPTFISDSKLHQNSNVNSNLNADSNFNLNSNLNSNSTSDLNSKAVSNSNLSDSFVADQRGSFKTSKPGFVPDSRHLTQKISNLPDKTEEKISMSQPSILPSKEEQLQMLAEQVAQCRCCPALVANRKQTVFGTGNPYSKLVFVGEGPGAEEDIQGLPFVGRSGQLLTDIITKGMQLRREDIYICNVVRCRPPGNRNPLPEEADACRPFLTATLKTVAPDFIFCLGAVAAHHLLRVDVPIGRLRGKIHSLPEIEGLEKTQVICTYHPAYLLRNPAAKRDTWEDVKLLMKAMGLPLPPPKLQQDTPQS